MKHCIFNWPTREKINRVKKRENTNKHIVKQIALALKQSELGTLISKVCRKLRIEKQIFAVGREL